MSRNHNFVKGEYYHVFNRGVDKRIIFQNNQDKLRFQKLLFLCNGSDVIHLSNMPDRGQPVYKLDRGKPLVAMGAYCLMNNHFHLLLREYSSGGVSKFMQRLATAYTMYFNIKNERTGSLFQGRFKSRHIKEDIYLKYIFSYIHLNPVERIEPEWKKKGIKNAKLVSQYLESYNFSSLYEYLGKERPETAILGISEFPQYFTQQGDYLEELNSWLFDFHSSYVKVEP